MKWSLKRKRKNPSNQPAGTENSFLSSRHRPATPGRKSPMRLKTKAGSESEPAFVLKYFYFNFMG
jgi:hypothetical protein